jgi:hypothetical protein
MVVNRDGENLLGVFLSNDVFIEMLFDFVRLRHFSRIGSGAFTALALLSNHGVAKLDAFVADANTVRPGNQVAGVFFGFAAKGADRFITGRFVTHKFKVCSLGFEVWSSKFTNREPQTPN